MTLRCLLVDDSTQFLAAARDLLEREGLVVAGTAERIDEALGRAAQLTLDVALVDINLGEESGFDLAERLRPTPVIMISTHDGDDYQDVIADSSAIGFLAKTDISARSILASLEKP